MANLLFEDIFQIIGIDADGKKFDKGTHASLSFFKSVHRFVYLLSSVRPFLAVSRIEARSEQFDMYMKLDVNTEVYPMHAGEKFAMVLAPTLSLDGTNDNGLYSNQVISYLIIFNLYSHYSLWVIDP